MRISGRKKYKANKKKKQICIDFVDVCSLKSIAREFSDEICPCAFLQKSIGRVKKRVKLRVRDEKNKSDPFDCVNLIDNNLSP